PEACREDYGQSLPPWTKTPCDTPLRQKAAVHQDQNLTPPVQLLPICGWPHQQAPGPPPPNTDSYPELLFARYCIVWRARSFFTLTYSVNFFIYFIFSFSYVRS